MGTRNLTVVFDGGTHRIAQYGQWDGYPRGAGRKVLDFCRKRLATDEGREAFRAAIGRHRFGTEEELKSAIDVDDHPHLSRNLGAEILEYAANARDNLLLSDSIEFAQDSLFCEWAYVIDLDTKMLEAYQGFNKLALDPDVDRFALREPGVDPRAVNAVSAMGRNEWQPIKIMACWPLSDLPQVDEFLAALEPPGEDDP